MKYIFLFWSFSFNNISIIILLWLGGKFVYLVLIFVEKISFNVLFKKFLLKLIVASVFCNWLIICNSFLRMPFPIFPLYSFFIWLLINCNTFLRTRCLHLLIILSSEYLLCSLLYLFGLNLFLPHFFFVRLFLRGFSSNL